MGCFRLLTSLNTLRQLLGYGLTRNVCIGDTDIRAHVIRAVKVSANLHRHARTDAQTQAQTHALIRFHYDPAFPTVDELNSVWLPFPADD